MVALCYHLWVPPKRFNPSTPSFGVSEVRQLAADRAGIISTGAADGAAKLGYFNEDIWEALEQIEAADFYKTDIWRNRPDEMVDVYYIQVGEHSVYLKFSIVDESSGTRLLIVSSFKENY
jgi:hypothetical protein